MGRFAIKLILTVIFSTVMAVGCGGSSTAGVEGSKQPPGSIGVSDDALDIVIVHNALEYPISGFCNFASKNPVVVAIAGVAATTRLECQSDDTFNGVINMSSVTSSPAVVTISQAESSASIEVKNELVPLAVTALDPLPNPSEGGAPTHRLIGTCDGSETAGSVSDVVVEITSLGIKDSVTCTPNTGKSTASGSFRFEFPMGTNGSRALTLQLTQGSWTTGFTYSLATPVTPLALDALEILNLSTAGAYVIEGKCDSSLEGQSLRIHIQESGGDDIATVAPKQVLCVKSGESANTFSVSFSLAHLTESSIIFHASYGQKDVSSAILANNIVSLGFSTLASIVAGNISDYLVEGACDSSLSGQSIRISVRNPEENPEEIAFQEVSCDATLGEGLNTFAESFDLSELRGVLGSSVTFYASYGGQSVESPSVANEVIPLSFGSLSPLNLSSAAAYEVSGRCDASVAVPVTVSLKNLPGVPSKTSLCSTTDNAFSLSFDLRTLSVSEVIFELSHGSENSESSAVANNIVNLALDLSTLVNITSANASLYTLSGFCDSSLNPEKVQVTVGTPDVVQSADCLSNSSFSVRMDVSEVVSNPAAVLVTYGAQEQTSYSH